MDYTSQLVAGKYRLTRMVGRGGMGSVWEAVHVSLDTRVAVKFIDAEYVDSPEARRRFENEARAAAALRSRYVVEIYDHGVTGDGRPFIVMEFLDGEPLDRRLDRLGRLTPRATAGILGMVCKAMSRAHALGIVHRDLKPENVFLVWDAEARADVAKVVDFGIVKFTDSTGLDVATRTGSVIGTPHYMSPEQARGLRGVDHRSDLWSIAVLAFRCITGLLPFDGEAVGDVLVKLCTAPIPMPSSVAPEIPPGFDGWIQRALQREPAARFQSAEDLGRSLAVVCGLASEDGVPPPKGANATTGPPPPQRGEARPGPAATQIGDWSAVRAAIPADLEQHATPVLRFLMSLFLTARVVESNRLLLLSGPRFPESTKAEFLALFLGNHAHADRRFHTRTFLEYADPLEAFLKLLDTGKRKIVIAIVDSLELGGGIREKIFEFNRRYAATVLPFHVGDLSAALDDDRAFQLFLERFTDFHVFPDVFGPAHDSVSLFGRAPLNQLVASLGGASFAVVHGPPGSGKSSVIRAARSEKQRARFVIIGCFLGESRPAALVERIQRKIGPKGSSSPSPSITGLRECIAREAERSRAGREQLVLVLEDADWAIRGLLDDTFPERIELQKFWAFVAETATLERVNVVVTSVWGALLCRHDLGHEAVSIMVGALAPRDLEQMLRDLGSQINVRFEANAVHKVFRLSAGNVCIARMLCRQLVLPPRQERSPLDELVVTEKLVNQAAGALAKNPETFGGRMLACLTPLELDVLRAVAQFKPRNIAVIRRTLGNKFSHEECRKAVTNLQNIGFCTWQENRECVSVPLFESWVLNHLVLPDKDAESGRAKQLKLVFAGLAASMVLVLGYLQSTADQNLTWRASGCEYTLSAPQRIVLGSNVSIRTVRSCHGPVGPVALTLEPVRLTFARFAAGSSPTAAPEYVLGGGVPTWVNDKVQVVFEDIGQSSFTLRVRGETTPSEVELRLRKDWMNGLVTLVWKFANAVPILIGALLAIKDFLSTRVPKAARQ